MTDLNLSRRTFLASASALSTGLLVRTGFGEETKSAFPAKDFEKSVSKGLDYLATKGQAADGSFSKQVGIGITAIATTAFLRHGRSPDDPVVKKSLKYLEEFVQATGGIHAPGGKMMTYETCVTILCFASANKDKRYDKLLAKADKFLHDLPFDSQEGHEKSSTSFGGTGYGGQGRPDLSNTAFFVEAVRGLGHGADDPAIQNALIFISRCQNLESPHNTTPLAAKINDGGFYYSPVVGDKEREEAAVGGLRSYGAMSYSGLKSMIFAGLKKDDPRVKAVLTWVGKNYDVSRNPGMGEAGLFYYYLTFAKALDALGESSITDAKGTKHDWRTDLVTELARRQRDDGGWVNTNSQWMEGDANLCTSLALVALSHCVVKS